jgi:hypothetical protein
LALVAANPVWAAEGGRTALLFLDRTVGARVAGMGEAGVANEGGIGSVYLNPAGLAGTPAPTISMSYLRGFVDDNFGAIHYAHPLPFATVYAGAAYFDAGKIDLRLSDGTQESRRAETDTGAMLGLALGRTGPVALGVVGKYFKSELAEEATAAGVAADAGLVWRTPVPGLELGGAYQNLGPKIKYEVEEESLPLTTRFGAAYTLDLEKMGALRQFPYRFTVAADRVLRKDEDSSVNLGFEAVRDMVVMDKAGFAALRAGYVSASETLTAGFGFKTGPVVLDYAFAFVNDLSDSHRFTIAYQFGRDPDRDDPAPEPRHGRSRLEP